MSFTLEVQGANGWVPLAHFEDLDMARLACNRAIFSEKTSARIVEHTPEYVNVAYERHYNIRDDPDENWRDDLDLEEEGDVVWQQDGF